MDLLNQEDLELQTRIDEILEEREKASNSLHEFIRQAWHVIEHYDFVDNWHIGAISEHVEAVLNGQIRLLIINIPPRSCKSTICSVMLVPYVWIKRPWLKLLYSSHTVKVAGDCSNKARLLIQSEWYKTRFGHIYQLRRDQNSKYEFETDAKGCRKIVGINAGVTGLGGDYLIADDPNNVHTVESDCVRESTNLWWSSVWSTRLNDRKRGGKILIQQRSHARDVTGYILNSEEGQDAVKLILPMEFEKGRGSKTIILPSTNGKKWCDPRTKEGELLWPQKIDAKELTKMKQNELRSTYAIAGQLQQRPSPAGGSVIKKDYFQIWKKPKPPKIIQIIQSWDTALEGNPNNDYSACTTWGLFEDENGNNNLILLSLFRAQLEYPDLRYRAQRLCKDYRDDGDKPDFKPDNTHKPDLILIEAKASGHSLIHDLRRGGIPVIKFDPTKRGDKITRVRLVTHLLEAGRVFLPARPPDFVELRSFADLLVDCCISFRADRKTEGNRDVVDTMTQVLLRLMESGTLVNPKDYVPQNPQRNTTYF